MSRTSTNDEPVTWVVNDLGELGVELPNGRVVFLYKGECIEYDGHHDDGSCMRYRKVAKREFGEVCHPRHWYTDCAVGERVGKENYRYTAGTGWQDLLRPNTKERKVDAIQHILVRLKDAQAHPEDDERFSSCVADTLMALNIQDIELANDLGLSRSTVNRWRNGKSFPHPIMRKPVYDALLRRARGV